MLKTFLDPRGKTWQVWPVIPEGGLSDEHLSPALRSGWLAFRTDDERRRLYPIPLGWENDSVEELWALCQSAKPVSRIPEEPTQSNIEAEAFPLSVTYPQLAELKEVVRQLGLNDERLAIAADLGSVPPDLIAEGVGCVWRASTLDPLSQQGRSYDVSRR
jgi:hypothetical protein